MQDTTGDAQPPSRPWRRRAIWATVFAVTASLADWLITSHRSPVSTALLTRSLWVPELWLRINIVPTIFARMVTSRRDWPEINYRARSIALAVQWFVVGYGVAKIVDFGRANKAGR